jgi:uncharacterized protein YecA (UPF0149 family)
MHVDTGEIFDITSEDHLKAMQTIYNNRLMPLTEKQTKILKPLSKRKRRWLMKHGSCPCGSDKSFKKCCLKKYKK